MPKRPAINPVRVPGRAKPWVINLPPSLSPSGKRQRFFFDTKQSALNYAEKQRVRLQNYGSAGSSLLGPASQEQAANALEMLKPYGATLNEVVADWISRRQAAEASITFEAAMDAFMEFRQRSESYTRSIRQTKNRLAGLHGKMLNQITPADLTRAMDGMTASVRNFTIRILGGLFNFGIKRDFCSDNPTRKLDLSQHERAEIKVYSPVEVGSILHAAEEHDGELVPFLALSFFAGIRLSEMTRLDWTAVDLHEFFVRLPASITKTRQTRNIDISTTLAAWLTPHAQEAGKVVPCSPDSLRNRMEGLKSRHNVETIKHGPRHCFASYWLAQHGDINQLCRFLGHDDPETTFRHYAKAATKREAEKFFAVLPRSTTSDKIVNIKRRAS